LHQRSPLTLPSPNCRPGFLPSCRVSRHTHASASAGRAALRAKRTGSAETLALAWKWFARLAEQGKDATNFASVLATYAAKAVRNGRRLCGQERAKDVMSPVAQRNKGFQVESLPTSARRGYEGLYGLVHGQQELDAYEERLQDNSVTPPPDAAGFRIDFPRFLRDLTQRDRDLAMFLSLGHHAKKAADRFGLSPGRVTQLRQRWCRDWKVFQGDEVESSRQDRRAMEPIPA